MPVFRDWKLPDTGETQPRRINNHARQRPFANIEATQFIVAHHVPSSKFNLTFQILPSSLSFRPYFLLRRCLIIFRFSCFPFPFVFSFLSCLFSWSTTQWFFDVSLMVISMEKKRVHGVRFTGEENFSTMNSDRFSSYPFLCSPANCFFPSVQSEPEWRSPPVFRPRRLPQTGY